MMHGQKNIVTIPLVATYTWILKSTYTPTE